ncbi:hypothetical protein NC653_024088 [Populus alba x Populus x berolinensis]|uniref:DUF4283 domain-containing protein n=1 Tax=Populus alba x Populus x berolinensis TaxID=444605 RepID=A0AAD6QBJ7_9ROSI|nr:hypothetical protein NC653_024088 [Populus alba x Populus x berolinensis]
MARNKRTTRRTTVQNQQQLQVELHNNSVLALAAPPLPPSPPPLTPSPKVVAGGSSPDKFVFFAEEGAVQQPIVPSPSTPDHIIVEDCSDQEDFEDEEVDYSASGEYPSSFHSPLPTSTGKIVDINPNSASRVSPISESGHSVTPEPSPYGPQAPAPVEKWRDLFATNRSTITGPKLPRFSASCNDLPCDLVSDDLDNNYNVWELCIVGYIAGKSPGFKALNNIISSSWKCDATLSIHESGWLVYKFKNIDDKLAVLANGPYLIYGRPLILKAMPEYFSFGKDEMACVPVWVKFPNLPLKCWSPRCLAKIASKLGTPIQSDQLTCNMLRISYARVLVELDLSVDLKSSIAINLPNGTTLNQPVIYETLPRFCTLCKVLGHKTGACTPPPKPWWQDRKARNSPSISKPNNAMGNKGSSQSSQQPLDPLQAEVEAVSGGWEVVKGKKSNSSHKETPITATHQRITSKDKEVACNNKGKEVAGPTDVRVRGDESITHQNISNEGTTGSNVVLLRTEKQSREDISVGCNVRTGETVGNEITQKAAPPASPGVVTRSNTRKSGGSGRRPPTSPAGK